MTRCFPSTVSLLMRARERNHPLPSALMLPSAILPVSGQRSCQRCCHNALNVDACSAGSSADAAAAMGRRPPHHSTPPTPYIVRYDLNYHGLRCIARHQHTRAVQHACHRSGLHRWISDDGRSLSKSTFSTNGSGAPFSLLLVPPCAPELIPCQYSLAQAAAR
jgi:hypothetical protein